MTRRNHSVSGLWASALATLLLVAACEAGPPACDPDNGGLSLPDGFCAVVVVDSIGPARHLDVAANGDIFVAIRNTFGPERAMIPGGVIALRDVKGDGRIDEQERWGENGGNEVVLAGGYLYFATDDAVLRYPHPEGSLSPSGAPDTLVSGLPVVANQRAKSLAVSDDGSLFVNIGSPSNACQVEPRGVGSPGQDPCPQLEARAGIWRFEAGRTHQTQADGQRFATGLRNTVALRLHPSGALFGVVHGRDQLSALWPTSRPIGLPTIWSSTPAPNSPTASGAGPSWHSTAPGTAHRCLRRGIMWPSPRSQMALPPGSGRSSPTGLPERSWAPGVRPIARLGSLWALTDRSTSQTAS